MARTKLPDSIARRHLLEGELDAEKAFAFAEAYLESDREVEAIDFLAIAHAASHAEAASRLAALRASAQEHGDVFLMRSVCGVLGEALSGDDWRALAETASRNGRERDAETAMRLATSGDSTRMDMATL